MASIREELIQEMSGEALQLVLSLLQDAGYDPALKLAGELRVGLVHVLGGKTAAEALEQLRPTTKLAVTKRYVVVNVDAAQHSIVLRTDGDETGRLLRLDRSEALPAEGSILSEEQMLRLSTRRR